MPLLLISSTSEDPRRGIAPVLLRLTRIPYSLSVIVCSYVRGFFAGRCAIIAVSSTPPSEKYITTSESTPSNKVHACVRIKCEIAARYFSSRFSDVAKHTWFSSIKNRINKIHEILFCSQLNFILSCLSRRQKENYKWKRTRSYKSKTRKKRRWVLIMSRWISRRNSIIKLEDRVGTRSSRSSRLRRSRIAKCGENVSCIPLRNYSTRLMLLPLLLLIVKLAFHWRSIKM